jgi:hypothetical protein
VPHLPGAAHASARGGARQPFANTVTDYAPQLESATTRT